MVGYEELNDGEKRLFDMIEKIFINHASITQPSFCRVLALLLNKHKQKKSTGGK